MNIFFLFDKNCSFCRDGIRVLKTFNYDFKINFIACQDYNLNYDKQLESKNGQLIVSNVQKTKKIMVLYDEHIIGFKLR